MRSSYPRRERPLQGLCYPVVYHGVVVAQNDRAKGCVIVDVFVAVGIERKAPAPLRMTRCGTMRRWALFTPPGMTSQASA